MSGPNSDRWTKSPHSSGSHFLITGRRDKLLPRVPISITKCMLTSTHSLPSTSPAQKPPSHHHGQVQFAGHVQSIFSLISGFFLMSFLHIYNKKPSSQLYLGIVMSVYVLCRTTLTQYTFTDKFLREKRKNKRKEPLYPNAQNN